MSEAPAYQRFFAELKRRKVFRVMAVYGGVAFVILQVADIALPGLGLPEWTLTLILLLTLLGFPLAIVLAWAFEMTPDGVKKTAEAGPGEITQIVEAPAASRWPVGLAAAGGTALFLVGAWLMFGRPAPGADGNANGPVVDPDAPVESIAVLPFADLSPAGEQEYFGDGLAEELLDALANVDGLVVAARTSSFRFKGDDVDIPEVAEKLGVQTVLEGSVRSGGDRVRITAQLVNAAGFHLWSDSYDRTIAQMQDLITVQEEIAQAIVAALSLAPAGTETGDEPMETLVAQGTDNLEAYNAVLRGRHLAAQRTPRSLELAAEQFERAVALDPGYAKAWADLGMTNSLRRGWGFDLDSIVEARGAEATERALELDPDMAEAHTARGYIYAFIHRDSAAADQAFARAIELDPRYPTAYHWRGEILGDTGHPDSGIPYLERARELDPLSPIILVDLATALDQAGRWDEAEALYQEILELEPDFAPAFAAMTLHARLNGDAEAALNHSLEFLELTPGADPMRTGVWGGTAYFLTGDLPNSVEQFRRALPTDTAAMPDFTRWAVPAFLFALENVEGTDAVEAFLAGQLSRTDAADSLYAIWLEGYGRVVAGDDAGGRTALRRLEAVEEHPNWMTWSLLEAIGDPDPWFAKSQTEFESNEFRPTAEERFWLEHDPSLAPMRADPRFEKLLDRLPPYPGPAGRN
ncbi:MAG: tetratricopeptide repeat protein [Gemmatimonadota bacterium]